MSVYTPLNGQESFAAQSMGNTGSSTSSCNSRQNLHLLAIVDDFSYVDHQVNVLKSRGVKTVNLPSMSDLTNLLPFLLINDHSIVIVKNPKKDLLPVLKSIIRTGSFQK